MRKILQRSERGMAFLLAFLMAVSSPASVLAANPIVSKVKDEGNDLDYTFTENTSEDGTSADIQLEVIEKNGNMLTEVTMPDGTVIFPEARDGQDGFKQSVDGAEKNVVHYEATENGTVKFKLKYNVPILSPVQEEPIQETQEQPESQPEFQSEPQEETQPEAQPEPTEKTEPESQIEAIPEPGMQESEVQEPEEENLVSKVVDTIFPVLEVQAAEPNSATEERMMEVSYEVTSIVPEKETEDENAEDTEVVQKKYNNANLREDVVTDTTGSIAISVNNTAITRPEDFVIGEPSQDLINLTVVYAPSSSDSGRKAKITIPEGFNLAKVPSASDLVSAFEITQNGNTLEISFYDSMNIMAVFDIQVKQDKELLYRNASVSSKDYVFLLEGFADNTEPVLNENLVLPIPELMDADYQIDMNPNLLWGDVKKPSLAGSNANVLYTLKITKKAKTKRQDDFEIYVPKTLQGGQYHIDQKGSFVDSITVNGTQYWYNNFNSNFSSWSEKEYFVIKPKSEFMKTLIQNAYLQDSTIECKLKYETTYSNTDASQQIFCNEKYTSITDLLVKADDKDLYTSSLTLDTTNEGQHLLNFSSSQSGKVQLAGTDVVNSISITSYPYTENIRDVEVSLNIPEEFQVKGISSESNITEIKTNKGRTIVASEISGLGADEYVTVIKAKGNIYHHSSLKVDLDIHIREHYVDGRIISSPTYANITGDVSSTEQNVQERKISQSFKITNRISDNLEIRNSSYKYQEVLCGTTDRGMTYYQISAQSADKDTQRYENAVLEIMGQELLSLTDAVSFTGTDTEIEKFRIKYTTYSSSEEREAAPEKSSDGRYYARCLLAEGDYITSLKICSTELDLNDAGIIVQLTASQIPEMLPLDNSSLDEKSYATTIKFSADNTTKTREETNDSCTFRKPVDADILTVNDMSAIQKNAGEVNIELGSIHLDKIDDSGRIEYKNPVIDFTGADSELLSWVRGGRIKGKIYNQPLPINWHITTNKGRNITVSYASNPEFPLGGDEYITDLKMVWDYGSTSYIPIDDVTVTLFGTPQIYSKITGEYIGNEYKSYTLKTSFEADNKEKYEQEGKSISISGKGQVTATSISSIIKLGSDKIYQGNSFDISITPNIAVTNSGARDFNVKNPVFYLEVDSRYSFESGSIATSLGTVKATWKPGKLGNGNSVLKIELQDYLNKVSGTNIIVPLTFKLRVKPSVEPERGVQPIISLWADMTETTAIVQPEGYVDVILENTVKDTVGIQDDAEKEFYTVSTSVSGGQEILPVNEMGISSLGIENASFGETVKGHDNDKYGQQLSIISNYDVPTKDWIIYVPIPKEGKSVHYKTLENGVASIGESPEAGIGMNLTGPVEIGNAPAGTRVSYTTNENPAYSLDGSSAGNYSESVSDWSKVTMVKIEVPELEAKGKIYPVFNYASDTKIKPKDLLCYGGVYFNTKVGDALDYFYGSEGSYTKNNTYTIIDYKVTGHVWEEMAVPSDHILTDTDKAKAGVTVFTTGKDGKTLKAVTDADGDYTLVIPSHGDYDISIQMPDNDHTKPKEKYSLVDAGQGTENNSSKFDSATKKVSVTLDKDDIDKQNAGLWAERIAFVEPEDIYMAKGTTENVPVYYFPSYVKVTFGQADDTSIATVSDDGVITAIETGVTQAEVSIPDGRGGTVTDTYNIHVIPQKPTAVPEIVHIFEGGSFDPKSGVTITDGDGNIIPVDDPKITIDNPVDTSIPGKYIVTYTITDEYDRVVKAYRSIYVHEKIQIVKPDDWLTKTGTQMTSLDGVSASYGQVQEDGSIKRVDVPVGAVPADTFTLNDPGKQKVELTASVVYEGASDTANASYTVTFNDRPVITAPDEIYVKPGTSGTTLAHAINGTAAMETADGSVDLTDELIYERDSSFDTSVPNSSGKVTLEVTDPDTGEVITKEVVVHITGEAVIAAEDLDVVVGQAYDPSVKVIITDGRGNPVTFTPDMVKKGNVPLDDDGKLTTIGEYEVTYHYTDAYGNEAETTRTVKVNGALTLVTPDKHLRQEAGGSYTPDTASVYYRNSKNEKIEVTGGSYDVNVDLTDIKVTAVKYTATHPLSKEETEQGFDVYVHGNPVITAEGDSIYTHTSTGTDVLVDVIKAGNGNGHKTPAAAYVEYARKDGTTQKVDLTAFIQYEVSDTYTEKTAGTYPVKLTVSDALYVLAAAPGLAPAETASSVDVEVADKIYTVKFALKDGERGGTLSGDTADQNVKYNQYAAPGAEVSVSVGSAFLGWSYSYTPAGTTTLVSGTVMDYTTVPILNDVTFTANFAKVPFVSGSSTNGFVSVQKGGAPADAGTDTITKIEYDLSDTLPAEAGFKFAGIPHYHIDEIKVSDLYNHEFILNLSSTEKQSFTVGEDGHTSDIQVSVDKANGTVQVAGIDESLMFSFAFTEDTKYTVSFKEEKDSTDNWGQNKDLYTGDVMGNAPAEEPVKPGCTFGGWSSDGNNSPDKMYNPNALITDKDEVYYAVWIPKEYTIHYNTDGGTAIPDKTGVHYADKGLIPADNPTKTGYIFAGWEKDTVKITGETVYSDLVADDTVMEVTLTAKWEIKHFNASWVLKDDETLGSIEGGNQKEEGIAYKGNATKDVTAAPASNDSEFIGWEYSYIPDGSTMPVTGFTDDYKTIPVLGDITFTARFAAKPFISIGATNGKVTAAKGITPEEISESSGTTALVQFTAADDIENKKGEAALKYAADMHHHLTTVSFKDTSGHEYTVWTKDGSGITADSDYEVGDKTPATKVTVELDEQNGTILVSNIDTSLAFTVVFEEDPKYKVEFFRDKEDPASLVQTNDGLYTGNPVGDKPKEDPTKPGYRFLGWSGDGTNAPDKMYSPDARIADGDIAYYGVWELIDYKLAISNTVAGEYGNKKQDFHFTITLKDKDGKPLSGTYPYSGAAIGGVEKPGDGTVTLDVDGTAEITLKHGQSIILDGLHIGEQYTVVETEADQNGYITTSTGDTNLSITDHTAADFTNTRTIAPPTGVGPIKPHPPALILSILLLLLTCIGFLWARRRRRA